MSGLSEIQTALLLAFASVPCAVLGRKIHISSQACKIILGADLTGIGGSVFLSPAPSLFCWMKPKTTDGIAAGFTVLNSFAGLAGAGWVKVSRIGPLIWLTVPALIDAVHGASYGARRWSSDNFSRVLAAVLVFAGGKLLFEATN